MPWNKVLQKFKEGRLKSGGSGKPVKSRKQAVAIMLSEKKQAAAKPEYRASRAVTMHDKNKLVRKRG